MAEKSLIIVESPAKTRTIKNYLGESFEVVASMGHVRDLPENGLGVDVEHNFAPEYVIIKDKVDTLSKLRKAAKSAQKVYLATDPDREGEAIAWHLHEALGLQNDLRIEFNEITKSAITHALDHPRTIDMARVNAQQARRVLDRLVGYQLSPLLWRKVRRGLSAGRVQSVAVKLVCDREREIQAFVPEEYWTLIAEVCRQGEPTAPFFAKLTEFEGKKFKPANEEQARKAEADLKTASYQVGEVKRSEQRRNPQPPFITSTLQQEAFRSFGFSAKRTMALAQQLYEGLEMGAEGHVGLITYMRTDSTRVSKEAQEQAAHYVESHFGTEYLPGVRKEKAAVKGAQEAHEAIRPTDVARNPESLARDLNPDQLKLYRLIWKRFLASQMASAVLDVMSVDVQAGAYTLRATGQRVKFDGYLVLSPDRSEGEFLPPMKEGDPLDLLNLKTDQHFTQPPARYTEATLIKSLEARGIGRPSTYAPIISTILDRRYVFLEEKKFHPTGLGMVVTEQLEKHFANIIDYDFTAKMEEQLDAVESGDEEWVRLLAEFYGPFNKALDEATETMQRIKVPEVELEQKCPNCGKQLVLREGRFGRFVACTGFPECSFTAQEDQFLEKREEGGEEKGEGAGEEQPEVLCEQCGAPMVVRRSRRGPFYGCSRYPDCTTTKPLSGDAPAKKKEPAQLTTVACENCGKPMAIRSSRRGKFLGCSGYPKCKTTKPMPAESVELLAQPDGEGAATPVPVTEKPTKRASTKKVSGDGELTAAATPKKRTTTRKKKTE